MSNRLVRPLPSNMALGAKVGRRGVSIERLAVEFAPSLTPKAVRIAVIKASKLSLTPAIEARILANKGVLLNGDRPLAKGLGIILLSGMSDVTVEAGIKGPPGLNDSGDGIGVALSISEVSPSCSKGAGNVAP